MTGEAATGTGAGARAWARMVGLAAVVIALDQATKAIVRGAVERGEQVEVVLGLRIVNVRNSGIAFGLLDDGGTLLLVITAVTLAVLVGWFASGPSRPGLWIAIGLLVGGALGNLIDRVDAQEVTDFVDLPAWPAFNLADVAITAGVLALILLALGREREHPADP